MTIHHDKLAYGKLAKMSEELSDEQITKMLGRLEDDEPDGEDADKKEGGDVGSRSDGKLPRKRKK